VVHARGIMPDGMPFCFPLDALPEPLDIAERFSPTQESHLVLLTIAPHKADRANLVGNGADGRFVSVAVPTADDTTGRDEKAVSVASKRFRLMLDAEEVSDLISLPIARVRRDGAGRFIYDPAWVPPCIQIGASERLMDWLARLIDLLESRADALASDRRGEGAVSRFAPGEIAGFWLSHAINSALPRLRHLLSVRTAHPEALFTELSRLAGALCTFSLGSQPRSLPAYDHDDLAGCVGALERHIRDHIEVILPTRALTIPLSAAAEFLFAAKVTDPRALGRGRWYLAVDSDIGASDVIARVPKLAKICSNKHIARLVREAFPGLPLEHVPQPPHELSPRPGTQYFAVSTADHPCWGFIRETAEVAVYLPAAVPVVRIEMKIIPE
jgi:type VI secretion system protein ImpJ